MSDLMRAPHEATAQERGIQQRIIEITPIAMAHADEIVRRMGWVAIDALLDEMNAGKRA